ncbi:amino acid adenylation domain-containing protein [Clostridium sp. 19966]|uniref:non-ribosomal peptide synthetase n=1 Tax=Clostridium sp. 19966 TaxID=2768166 RepID=UPI0028DD5F8A|nr:non-ribosomal peptide synthetase [Clostridium sp. 19966]MDT8717660.1 amino acid adenylation domain-containing protein [Clostridium sp. 19966]
MKKCLAEEIILGYTLQNNHDISFSKGFLQFSINPLTISKIKAYVEQDKSSVNAFMATVFNILLARYTGEEEIIIENLINLDGNNNYAYSIIKNNVMDTETFKSTLFNSHNKLSKIPDEFNNQDNYHNLIFDTVTMPNENINLENFKFGIWIKFNETSNGQINAVIEFNESLYEKIEIEKFASHFLKILDEVSEFPEIKLSQIDLLSEEETRQILIEFNATNTEYAKDKTAYELFEKQVELTPDHVAVVYKDDKLTYRELNEKANQLARSLLSEGVTPDSIVGIMTTASLEMIIGIMAILKSGAAYLPIDPEYPNDRVEYMLEDSHTNILLTQDRFADRLNFSGTILNLENDSLYDGEKNNLGRTNQPNNLAYIIYTSGSTGKPKGVMIEHSSLINSSQWHIKFYDVTDKDRGTKYAGFGFDASVLEIFPYLLSGAAIHIISEAIRLDIAKLNDYFEENNITISFLPTQICEEFMRLNNTSLKRVFTGGDKLHTFIENNYEIVNNYGPTENTVVTTAFKVDKSYNNIPIGKPIANSKIYIINESNKLQPIGVAGELCIAGDGLSRGYLNRPDLTKEKFVSNPFEPGEKMYKSGDLARWLPDGNIEFIGRIDHQVKIRGYRIELGEIENQILKNNRIKGTVVLAKEDAQGNKYLCAYIAAKEKIEIQELRKDLSKVLPGYMVPAYFIQIEAIPLTPNGKIDKKALPEPLGEISTGVAYQAPRNEIEEKLAKIWNEVLAIEKIGIDDDFFTLGGHSLNAMRMTVLMQKELGVQISVSEIFSQPTIRKIAETIPKINGGLYPSIEVAKEKEYYKVSSAQKRMFALNQLGRQKTNYNNLTVKLLEGKLEKSKVEEAFKTLIERQGVFRTSFEIINGEIVQQIHKTIEFKLDYEESDIKTREFIKQEMKNFVKPFDLSKAPLLRAKLIKLDEEKHLLMFDIHHIITDGSSMDIIMEDFSRIYNGDALEALRIQYKDYSEFENRLMDSEAMKKHGEYWKSLFDNEIPVLNLPLDYTRPVFQSFEGKSISFKLNRALTEKLREVSKANGATIYMFLLSSLNILLAKYSGQEDIIIGSAAAGRSHADLQGIVGMFINTLAMRNYPRSNKNFNDFLQEVKENSLKAYEHQAYSFDKLVEELSLGKAINRNPLFDIMFVLQNTEHKKLHMDGISINDYKFKDDVSKFDMTFEAEETDGEIKFNLEYCTKLFKRSTIEGLIRHFKNILNEIIENPRIKLSEINMLSEAEKKEILVDFNSTKSEYPRDKSICELFEEQAYKAPDSIAAVCESDKLTYRELNEKANQLANTLRVEGVTSESIVGIIAERSLNMLVGIVAILKAGGAYLPIDPDYPSNRINYMLEDSKADILLTEQELSSEIDFKGCLIDLKDAEIYSPNKENLENISKAENIAYVIYTSGTTGRPKGVAVIQRNVVRLVKNTNYIEFKREDKLLQTGSITFDASTLEIWGSLLNGIELHITSKDVILNGEKLKEYLSSNKITIMWLTSPLFNKLCEEDPEIFRELRCLLAGGDVVSAKNVNLVRKYAPQLTVINGYGPTENTTFSTCYVISENLDENKTIPIGKPIANSTAYILDKDNNLVPTGVYGELCVGGDGLAREYLNNKELTAKKFVENPFEQGQRMYRTGDLARWLPDGNIEFLGRIDYQVKIRGFRIELGEIEKALLKLKGIKEALVIDREEDGNKYLCAYIVSAEDYSIKKLREELKNALPDYMIPSYFIILDEMPLNQSGKIDRKALPIPDGNIETGAEYIAARNKIEEILINIWSEILEINKIGIDDDFFALGGHSLKAIKMVAMIQRELSVEISVGDIFKNTTVRSLGEHLEKIRESVYHSIEAVEEKEFYEVSSAQKRMYALNQFSKEEINYNIPSVFILEGKVEKDRIQESFNRLIERHEAFRTSFELVKDKIMQRIHRHVDFKMDYEEAYNSSNEAINIEIDKFVRPFDLSKAPLLRVKLIRLAEEKYLLMFDMHHIISDGSSMSIVMDEFTRLFKGENLKELRVQYKDYSAWENKMQESPFMKKYEEYWLSIFKDEIPVLNLPTDYPRPSIQSFEGASIEFTLEKALTEKLKKISAENGATLYMTLLSAYNILLSKYSGQDDIVVGSPIAGRSHIDLYNIVGMFINTLSMRNYPKPDKIFNKFLQEVKESALKAYENQNYQFDRLVEKLDIKRDLSRNALFDTMFILQNTENKELQLDNITIKKFPFEKRISKFDLTLAAEEKGDKLEFDLEYCTKLFKKQTMEKFIEHFKNILYQIINNPEITISDIDMLSEEERQEILLDFNNTRLEYDDSRTICQVFEAQVEKTPDNIAVVYENKKLTYRELNEKANQLARVLRNKGVKADSIVGMLMERSVYMLVGIMGILKAGGAYLPIAPEYPEERIKYMLEDSKAQILLTQKQLLNTTAFNGTLIDIEAEDLYIQDKANLPKVNTPDNLAYVIYTSGSTGKPKGVLIQHRNVINLVTALGKLIYDKYSSPLKIALIAQYVFDASVKQIFASVLNGNSLYIIPEEYRTIGEKLIEYYINNSIDISDGTPSHIKLMLSDNKENIKDIPVRHFVIGGEELTVSLVKEFYSFFSKAKPSITNIYGPTECCVDSTGFLVNENNIDKLTVIPIGKPLVNYKAYVLGKANKLQPIGVAGELCIGGKGLARGYLNRPELTEEKFTANPFESGERMYKTGDLVRWLPDGNIEFLGRIDYQVKIRGYRIEIGEIDALIKTHPSVKDSIVIVKEDIAGEKRLIAYVVPKIDAEEKYSEGSLREYLKKKLPKYMLPAVFVQIEKMPLNTNGKIDRFALPEPSTLERDLEEGFVAPRNKEEIEMAEIWSKILGVEKIGIDDDFFDLGGDSFKAIKLVRSISSSLGVMELFKNSTIRELAVYMSKDGSRERTMLNELTKPVTEKDKIVSLICFPYGGGSAISFQPLANALPPNYSLYSVELPGHDYSCPDEALASIEECAERCFQEIKQKVTGPIVLYGHCLGSTMAAFLAYKLEAAGIKIDGVITAAMFPAPRISNKFFDIWEKIFPSQLTDKGNRDMLKTIGGLTSDVSSEETEFILRNLKHDSKECTRWYTEVYKNKNQKKFKTPITCIIGESDRATEFYQERYKEWEHFSDNVDLKTIKNAGHFFFKNQAKELGEIIKEKVEAWQSKTSEVRETEKIYENSEDTKRIKVAPSMNLFLIVAIVQIISEIGTILSTFGTSVWVYKQTNVLSQFAMMFLLSVIPNILVLPFSGAIIDKIDRRLVLIASDILSAACSLVLLILLYTNQLQIWQVYIFTIVSSVAICFRQPAYMAAITQIAPKLYLTQANSVAQFSSAIGGILAPICGGIFMDYIGFKGLVTIDFATFLISIITLLLLRFPDAMFTRLEEPILKQLIGGWKFIVKRKSLVGMVLFFVIVNFLVGIFDVTITPLILSFSNASVLGIVNSFSGIGVLTGAIIMLITGGTKKRAKGMVGFVIPMAFAIMIAALRPMPVFAAVALWGYSFSLTFVNVHWQSLIQVKVGLELQGRVFAINQMMVSLLRPLSFITAGALADNVFSQSLKNDSFSSPIFNLVLGVGSGRSMRLVVLIAGAILLVWSVIGVLYKPLSEMDDFLEDAIPDEIIIKDKDKLQEIADKKIETNSYVKAEVASTKEK